MELLLPDRFEDARIAYGCVRIGYEAGTPHAIDAFADEAERIYGAVRTPVDDETLGLAVREGEQHLVGA